MEKGIHGPWLSLSRPYTGTPGPHAARGHTVGTQEVYYIQG